MNQDGIFEDLGNGVSRERFYDGRVVVFHTTAPKKDSVDTYMNALEELFTECTAKNQPCFYAFISNGEAALNEYARNRAAEITAKYPDVKGRAVFIVPQNPATTALKNFVERAERKWQKELERRVFYHQADGLKWLEEGFLAQR